MYNTRVYILMYVLRIGHDRGEGFTAARLADATHDATAGGGADNKFSRAPLPRTLPVAAATATAVVEMSDVVQRWRRCPMI